MPTPAGLDWRKELAVAVGELIAQPAAMDRFRQMLRECWARRAAEVAETPKPRGVELLPLPVATLAEQYAALAAIHDSYCADWKYGQPIDPWDDGVSGGDALHASIFYTALRRSIAKVEDGELTQRWLTEAMQSVADDLKAVRRRPHAKRGRQSSTNHKADEKLDADWRASGMTKADFAKARGLVLYDVRLTTERGPRSKTPPPPRVEPCQAVADFSHPRGDNPIPLCFSRCFGIPKARANSRGLIRRICPPAFSRTFQVAARGVAATLRGMSNGKTPDDQAGRRAVRALLTASLQVDGRRALWPGACAHRALGASARIGLERVARDGLPVA